MIVLTGLYTTLGGMRAVAYNDAVQVVVLIAGSAALTVLRPRTSWAAGASCGAICGSDMFNLWKPLIPAGVRGHLGAGAREERRGPGRRGRRGTSTTTSPGSACSSARRSSACGTGAPTSTSCSAPSAPRTRRRRRRGSIFAAFLKLFPVYLFIIPGLICFALAKSGKVPGLEGIATDRSTSAQAGASR